MSLVVTLTRPIRLLRFTCEVPSMLGYLTLDKFELPLPDRHFRFYTPCRLTSRETRRLGAAKVQTRSVWTFARLSRALEKC